MSTWNPTPSSRSTSVSAWASVMLYSALVTMGLMAGLYFDWDVAVMPGLAEVDDRTFVTAMQSFVVAIENPAFFLVAVGAFGFTLTAAISLSRGGERLAARWILAALALYVVGLLITAAVHMPINYALVDLGDPGQISDLAAARGDFGAPWRVANVARTVTCVLALLCVGRALSLEGRDLGREAVVPNAGRWNG